MTISSFKKVRKVKKISNKPQLNGGDGGIKKFLSKISGAFMLPISVMAIAGLFLGIGAAITSHAGKNELLILIGKFLQNLGNPVFAAMPLLFAAAIVIAFTEESGIAVFASIIGYMTFNMLQTPFIKEEFIQKNLSEYLKLNISEQINWQLDEKSGMYKSLTGYNILFKSAGRTPETMLNLVNNNLGIRSLQTSVFGGIIVGTITAMAYNYFKQIKLPNWISFFGGKRFVALVVIVSMWPISLIFMLLWPYIGYFLSRFGQASGEVPIGLDSFVFGFLERALIPFGLHHVFYAPLWWTGAGGDLGQSLISAAHRAGANNLTEIQAAEYLFDNVSANVIKDVLKSGKSGDQFLWMEFSKASVDTLTLKSQKIANALIAGKETKLPVFEMLNQGLNLNLGRFMQGKFPFMIMGLPAAALAMVFAAPKKNKKMAFGTVFPAALTSFTTGVTEPLEFTFLFLAPWLFWGFHAFMAGVSFMMMNYLGAHIGMTFSGGIIDMIIYGILPVSKGTNFWWAFSIGGVLMPLYFIVFYASIIFFKLETPGRGNNIKLFTKKDFKNKKSLGTNSQATLIVKAYGGWKNITSTSNCATRLRFDVKDATKVNEEQLKVAGAVGVVTTSENHVQAIFGPQAEQIHGSIKNLDKNIENFEVKNSSNIINKKINFTDKIDYYMQKNNKTNKWVIIKNGGKRASYTAKTKAEIINIQKSTKSLQGKVIKKL